MITIIIHSYCDNRKGAWLHLFIHTDSLGDASVSCCMNGIIWESYLLVNMTFNPKHRLTERSFGHWRVAVVSPLNTQLTITYTYVLRPHFSYLYPCIIEFRADSSKVRSSFYIKVFYYQSPDVSAGTRVNNTSLAICIKRLCFREKLSAFWTALPNTDTVLLLMRLSVKF